MDSQNFLIKRGFHVQILLSQKKIVSKLLENKIAWFLQDLKTFMSQIQYEHM